MKFIGTVQAVLAAVTSQWSSVTPVPQALLDLSIRPCLNNTSCHTPYLEVHASLQSTVKDEKEPVLSQTLMLGNIQLHPYNSTTLTAYDDDGPLVLEYNDTEDNQWRHFYSSRTITGPLHYHFRAQPRKITRATKPGPRQELRYEPKGFNGGFLALGPLPPVTPDADVVPLAVVVSWDLEDCPDGTIGTWSFGDGPKSSHNGTVYNLWWSYFAVGNLKETRSNGLSINYFSQPPFDITEFTDRLGVIFQNLCNFFHDKIDTFKVMLRKNTNGAFGGSGGARTFILEYGEDLETSLPELTSILTHEFIHNWALLKDSNKSDKAVDDQYVGWYVEGIAMYYQTVLPYRFNITTTEQVLEDLNRLAVKYYTSPAVHLSNQECELKMWEDWFALEMIYSRGAMHLFDVAGLIRDASHGEQELDDIVLTLVDRREDGRSYDEQDWLRLLGSVIGDTRARRINDAMNSGRLIVPSPYTLDGSFIPGLRLGRNDKEMYELGFDRDSLYSGKIIGVVEGSRAAIAGLENGDEVIHWHLFSESTEDVEQTFSIVVRKPGAEAVSFSEVNQSSFGWINQQFDMAEGVLHQIEYLPRAIGKLVESWEWIEMEE